MVNKIICISDDEEEEDIKNIKLILFNIIYVYY